MSYANRGQTLEEMIKLSNEQYLFKNRALIQKIPTPVKVLNINSKTGKINNGFYDKKSTVDYIGVYNGYSLAYDAKETNVETRFDLKNIKEHQYNFLKNWQENGGISFLIISFVTFNEVYFLPFSTLKRYWIQQNKGGRKSIPYQDIAQKEYEIKSKGFVILDYLAVVDKIID